jgi:hypothetical protein
VNIKTLEMSNHIFQYIFINNSNMTLMRNSDITATVALLDLLQRTDSACTTCLKIIKLRVFPAV